VPQTAIHYWPVVLTLAVAVAIGSMTLTVGYLFRPRRPSREKALPYECGNDPSGEPNAPANPRFWFFAVLLVLLDVEVAFLVPWALAAASLGTAGFLALLLFFGVLAVGYAWLWRNGDLSWD
jgi:NADH-quinone oxidoreductase subunit A